MIYFDNGATTLPKPDGVFRAVRHAMGLGNPGRGGHNLSLQGARLLYSVREHFCTHFSAPSPNHVCFFYSATEALNRVMKSVLYQGGTVLISDMEHNAVRRPALSLARRGGTVCYFKGHGREEEIVSSFGAAVKEAHRAGRDVKLAVFLHTSNICRQTLPVKKLTDLCRKNEILSLVDCAQAAGHLPLHLQDLGADGLCMPSHKGLFGIAGAGVLLCSQKLKDTLEQVPTLVQGGAGSASLEEDMPLFLPERLEAGTPGLPAIASMGAGLSFIEKRGYEQISGQLSMLYKHCADRLMHIQGITLQASELRGIGPLLFTADHMDNAVLSDALSARGVCVREGLHCAPLAHDSIGTGRDGGIRVSFSVFNTTAQIDRFVCILKEELCAAGACR